MADRILSYAGVVLFTEILKVPGDSEVRFTWKCVSWGLPPQWDIVIWILHIAGQVDLTGSILIQLRMTGNL